YGNAITQYREAGEEYDVFVRLSASDRKGLRDIRGIIVTNRLGQNVPLSNIATIEESTGPLDIERKSQSRIVAVEGDNSGRGVDLGYFRPGQLNQWSPEIETAVWGLDVGKTAGPIKTARGYYIIKLTDRKPPRDKTLEESRDEVAAAIQAQKRKEKFDALEARLKNRTFIARNEQALNALKDHVSATP
ncbi:MAG: efflux RND transporter permease subunit, partial [Candidatus Aureabacteria bacterium]|nr:efflux RND transporter permease subunit [Candidatus Auribacterota bacterium]